MVLGIKNKRKSHDRVRQDLKKMYGILRNTIKISNAKSVLTSSSWTKSLKGGREALSLRFFLQRRLNKVQYTCMTASLSHTSVYQMFEALFHILTHNYAILEFQYLSLLKRG